MRGSSGSIASHPRFNLVVVALGAILALFLLGAADAHAGVAPKRFGEIDCNGYSPVQKPVKGYLACTDLRNPKEPEDRFWDGPHYIGHDEPDLNFNSSAPGSGDDVTWQFTIGQDPSALPTGTSPGHDISHYFELTPALWTSMLICDPNSYPQLPCKPESDSNAPKCKGNEFECEGYPGGGSAFMEMQFYPPGEAPWADAISVDNKHWDAALNVDSLEATTNFDELNEDCTEPVNFAYIQKNGIPPGPPSPQLFDLASETPNSETLLMNPGDTIRVHIYDAPVGAGEKALEAVVTDLTTGQTGYMQASAKNGFMNTSIANCEGTPFNFQPEFSTAKPSNKTGWSASEAGISASFETGHYIPCTSLAKEAQIELSQGVSDNYWNECKGPYEEASSEPEGEESSPEPSDAFCFPAGDEHKGLAAGSPNEITGCMDDLFQNGDLDFDGSPYWTEWPTSTTPTANPSTFKFEPPTFAGGQSYAAFNFNTDLAFSEQVTCTGTNLAGCATPPPNAPGHFYPYWTLVKGPGDRCTWEFGNVQNGNTFGGPAQYGQLDFERFPYIKSHNYLNLCVSH